MSRPSCLVAASLLLALSAAAQQATDEGYTKKIREFTTDPMFLTELVDHLPASAKVPTPEKILGYVAGAPDKLTYAADVHRYMRELAKASPRVRVTSIGQTEEGREMVLVLISDEANLARLDRLKDITARLADPRRTPDAEAEKLLAEGLPFYWATGAIHSSETGSPEMLMELAYRLAVEDTPFIQTIRKNMIVMFTPVLEVDGREKMVDLYRWRKANPGKPAPSLVYWGKYVAHDNNRDGMALSLALSRNITRAYIEYHPQVLHDLHESVPFLYTSTGMGPYNAWIDPIEINEWQKMAWNEVEEMTKRGVPGVWTWGFYDGWGANYLMQVAHGHNSIGRFYETFGNGGADTHDRTVQASQTSRQWFRPNPPLARVKWSHRNNVNMQQSALLLSMNYTARNRDTFLRNFWLKSKRAVAKAATEGPAAYVIDHTQRPNEAAALSDLLKLQGVEVHRLSQETEVAGVRHPVGSYIIKMDQPYSRMADMLLDKQFYNPNDTAPYDDTGWTLGALRNLKTTRVTDKAILAAQMVPAADQTGPEGCVSGEGGVYLVHHNADRVLATFRYKLADVKMKAAEESFEAAGRKFSAGSFIITADGNAADLKQKLQAAAADTGVTVYAAAEAPKAAAHDLAAPRIALVHTWISTQNEGWFRLALETTGVPYTYISDQKLREIPNLRDRFDVIVFGPTQGDSRRVVNGMPLRGEPIPWKASELTPNFGTSPDQTADMRGGMGLQGLMNVQKFVEEGGLFVTIAANSSIPIDFGLIDGVTITPARELKARGSVLDSVVADARSPIAYGYGERLPVYFNASPIFDVNTTGGFGGGRGQGEPSVRPSGRGGLNDPDVVQGRPPAPPAPPQAPGQNSEMMEQLRNFMPSPAERPRTVLRFADEKDLLISGMLAGGRELAGKPAVLDVPKGKGHYLLFAINPMWRQQTQGSYMLLLNAAMNFSSLGAGRPAQPAKPETMADDDDLNQ
ncbi:MAG: hypothetical protein HY858_12555 [Candidatus Solibacter usitatus]|nr:hypothetical protein [Candidatus Solibacter usitatus]